MLKSTGQWFGWGAAALLLLAGGCRDRQAPLEIPRLVKLTEVNGNGGTLAVTYPGRMKAASEVKLAFRVAGPLKRVYVGEGQAVKAGQLLAELDPRDYRLQYDGAKAEYEQVKGEAERVIELYRRGSVSINEYDKAVAARKRVTALYEANRNALEDTRLKAPFDGYIQRKYFKAPEIIGQGTPVLSMIGDGSFEVEVDIPAADFVRREEFAGFHAVADVYPDSILPLELLDVSRGANYNQLYNVRFRVKKDAAPHLAAGMSVSVTIDFKPSGKDVCLVPVSALFQQAGGSRVWVYDGDKETVRSQPVEVQRLSKDGWAVVRCAALRRGQSVVSAGVAGLKEGQKVKPLPPVSPSNVGGLL